MKNFLKYFRSACVNNINFVRLLCSGCEVESTVKEIFKNALSVSEGKRNLTRFYPAPLTRFFLSNIL